jgi:adenylate kinase family enzyme
MEPEPEPETVEEGEPPGVGLTLRVDDELEALALLRRGRSSTVEEEAAAEDLSYTPRTHRKRVVLVGGPPLAGKGTQCDLIVQRHGLVHVSSGDLLREHVRRGDELGVAAWPHMERGELVPTELVVAAVTERLGRPDVANRGCLLDNFPLTEEQARAMEGLIHPSLFIVLDVPREQLAARADGRRIDPETGGVYHLEHHPAPAEVARRLEQRACDADPAVVARRLETYERSAPAIRACFEQVPDCTVASVDAGGTRSATAAAIAALLDGHGWGATEDAPFIGSKAFGGAFSGQDAKRAGFFPDDVGDEAIGDEVVCFKRGNKWQWRGRVSAVETAVSDGRGGLLTGMVGTLVTVSDARGAGMLARRCASSAVCENAVFRERHLFIYETTILPRQARKKT